MKANRHCSQGAATVEFALVLVILLTLVFGTIEFGRALFQWNSAVDATRRGARTAAIVAMGDRTDIEASMYRELAGLQDAVVSIEYSGNGTFTDTCTGRGSCSFVRVGVTWTFEPYAPFVTAPIRMPPFYTTLPVEALGAT